MSILGRIQLYCMIQDIMLQWFNAIEVVMEHLLYKVM